VEFAIPDETYQDLINRLLDFVIAEAQRSKTETHEKKKAA
jgi:hypothetical protein